MGLRDTLASYIPGTERWTERRLAPERARIRTEAAQYATTVATRLLNSAEEDRRRPHWGRLLHSYASKGATWAHDLLQLMDRARLLVLEDGTSAGLLGRDVIDVVGPGFRVDAELPLTAQRRLGLEGDEQRIRSLTDTAEAFWRDRVASGSALDARGTRSYLQLTQLRYRQFKTDGNLFTRYRLRDRDLPFCLEFIPPENLATPPQRAGDDRLDHGIESTADGEVIRYWFREPARGRFRAYPRRNELGLPELVHLYQPLRDEIPLGLPWFTPVLLLLADTSDYLDSELQTKRLEADVALFVRSKYPDDWATALGSDPGLIGGQSSASSSDGTDTTDPKRWPKRQIWRGRENDELTQVKWDRPGSTFEPFVQTQQRSIGAGLNRSFERVSNNYGAANFSATRVSGIEDDLALLVEFTLFSEVCLAADWQWAMWAAAVETGEPALRHLRPTWQKHVKRSWDGLRDAKEATERLTNQTSSVPLEVAKTGHNYEQVQDQQVKAEQRLREKRAAAGLDQGADPPDQNAEETDDVGAAAQA